MNKMIKIDQQQLVIDEYMCTDTCPCLNDPAKSLTFNGKSEVDPNILYWKLSERTFNQYGRTKKNKIGYKIMNFTNDPKVGFINFEQCMDSWIKKSLTSSSVSLDKVFRIDTNPDKMNVDEDRPNLFGNIDKADLEGSALDSYVTLKFLESVENLF